MRMHSTRANPISISRAARNGNASLERSARVTDCSNSRERGPWTLSCANLKDSAYSPEVQYRTFRRLLDKHAAVDVIGGSVAGWHVLRDLYLAALLFLAGFLLSWPLNGEVNPALALSYMFVFGAQALFLMFSARGAGRRLVQNVLMVELGLDKADAGKEKKKKF